MVRREGTATRERGFTLIEMMIVVGVIALLAIVVVPQFFRESSKTRSRTEVVAMFAELSMKLEVVKQETNGYSTPTAWPSGGCPGATNPNGTASAPCITGAWAEARFNPPLATIRCNYEIETGVGGTANPPTGFTFTPTTNLPWYWIAATCDGDNDNTTDAKFFQTSVDSTLQALNEAH